MNTSELQEKIIKLKEEKNAIILAHYYQELEIQDVADFVGDSLGLAKKAAEVESDIIVFCGVKFMAETAKLLNEKSKVLLSNKDAGCPMADMLTGEQLRKFKNLHPEGKVVCYVNSNIEVKAESDICCTSSNAVKVAESFPKGTTILFVPDQNLGTYVSQKTDYKVVVWDGFCLVHHFGITLEDIENSKKNYPDHKILIHPECPPEVFAKADIVGSTQQMLDAVAKYDKVVIGTEKGLFDKLVRDYPNKDIRLLSENAVCRNMKKTSLQDVYNTLLNEENEMILDKKIAKKAINSVKRMIEL